MANSEGFGFDGTTKVVNCEECGKKIKVTESATLVDGRYLVHDECSPDPGENEQLTDF